MKKYLIIPFIIAVSFACNRKNQFTISATTQLKAGDYVFLSNVDVNVPVLIDSAKIKSDGSFRIKVSAEETDFYQVGKGSDFATILASPGEKVEMAFSNSTFSTGYEVKGSEGSELVREIDLKLIRTKASIDSLNKVFKADEQDPSSFSQEYVDNYIKLADAQRKYNIAFIINNIHSLAAIKALYQKIDDETYVLYQTRDLQYLKIVSDTLKKYYPGSKHTKALLSDFDNEMARYYSNQLQGIASSLPETVIDPDLADLNGKRVKLSSLKGRYVLVTFWSASSRECITENLQLKEYYRNYNRKGFEIYQINIDQDEELWRNAVKFDELPWISVREDDSQNLVNARLYNVKTLPSNFLYDREGNIIAVNLHGRALQIKLNQLFSN